MVSILKAVGREECKTDIVQQMLDPESTYRFLYTLEDPRNLILYDTEYENVIFNYQHSGISFIERYMALLFQQVMTKYTLLKYIKKSFDDHSLSYELNIKKYEVSAPLKRIKRD